MKIYKIIELNCETFGRPAIKLFRQKKLVKQKINHEIEDGFLLFNSKTTSVFIKKRLMIFIGGRDDFLRSFILEYL